MLTHGRRVDLIHAHGLSAGFVARIMAFLFRKKTVLSLHTIYRAKNRRDFTRATRVVVAGFDRVLALSQCSKNEIALFGVPSFKIVIARYWVNQSTFKPISKAECRGRLALDERLVLLFVGRLIESKGIRIILRAAEIIGDSLFVFVGEGPLENEVRRRSQLQSNIMFLGRKRTDELPAIYNCAHIVWGSVDVDYLGRVAIEALSCGVPVVTSNTTNLFGIPEPVASTTLPPTVGFLIEPHYEELANLLAEVNPQSLDLMSSKCREFALKFYGQSNAGIIERSYLEVFKTGK